MNHQRSHLWREEGESCCFLHSPHPKCLFFRVVFLPCLCLRILAFKWLLLSSDINTLLIGTGRRSGDSFTGFFLATTFVKCDKKSNFSSGFVFPNVLQSIKLDKTFFSFFNSRQKPSIWGTSINKEEELKISTSATFQLLQLSRMFLSLGLWWLWDVVVAVRSGCCVTE